LTSPNQFRQRFNACCGIALLEPLDLLPFKPGKARRRQNELRGAITLFID
jgi:hypothetical protein